MTIKGIGIEDMLCINDTTPGFVVVGLLLIMCIGIHILYMACLIKFNDDRYNRLLEVSSQVKKLNRGKSKVAEVLPEKVKTPLTPNMKKNVKKSERQIVLDDDEMDEQEELLREEEESVRIMKILKSRH